jgi:hypothetical protein
MDNVWAAVHFGLILSQQAQESHTNAMAVGHQETSVQGA